MPATAEYKVTPAQIRGRLREISLTLGARCMTEGDRIVKVTLRGDVQTYSQKQRAIEAVKKLTGSWTCEIEDTTAVRG